MVIVKLKNFKRSQFSHLTHSQWQLIKDFFGNQRKRKYSLRSIVNAILKLTRTGSQWRNMDEAYPKWQLVYYYFSKWQKAGIWTKVLNKLVEHERLRQQRTPKASRCAIDSQSVKKGSLIVLDTGIDGGKLINGRKRHLAVDSLGLPLAIHVGAANIYDGKAGLELLAHLGEQAQKEVLICTDHAYRGEFEQSAQYFDFQVQITQKPPSAQGFIPQPGRWQVERSFAWFNFFRRLSKDYEKTTESAVAFIQLVFIDIILARLDK